MPKKDLDRVRVFGRLVTADWVRRMREHYEQTGTYRAEDLDQALGNQTESVEVGAGASLEALFGAKE